MTTIKNSSAFLTNPMFILFILLTIPISTMAQLINGGLEDWETTTIEYVEMEFPVGWSTFTNIIMPIEFPEDRFFKDTDAMEGEYALRLLGGASAWFNCETMFLQNFTVQDSVGENASFGFWYKAEQVYSTDPVLLEVYLRLFHNGEELSTLSWEATEPAEEYTWLELDLPHPETDSIRLFIRTGGLNSGDDGCHNTTQTWLDGFSLIQDEVSPTDNIEVSDLQLFPNPSKGTVHIKGLQQSDCEYIIYDMLGNMLEKGHSQNQQIELHAKGLLCVELITVEQKRVVRKILNMD